MQEKINKYVPIKRKDGENNKLLLFRLRAIILNYIENKNKRIEKELGISFKSRQQTRRDR
jgi:hypothetical protein